MAGYPCPSIIPTDWFARCFLRSRTSRQEFAAEIDGSNVAASICGFPELVGDRSNQRLRAVPRELRGSACVSRVPPVRPRTFGVSPKQSCLGSAGCQPAIVGLPMMLCLARLPALPGVKETCAASLIRQVHRHALTSRKLIRQSANPFRKAAQIFDQIGAKTGKGYLRRCDHEQDAQKQQVHHINKNERKKCPVIAQIGLVLRNHPAGKGEMKGPGNTERRVEQLAIGSNVEE